MIKSVLVVLVIGLAGAVYFRDDIYDEFVEGDDDPWYLVAGRYEGTWKHRGDPNELAAFAPGLERIEFRIDDPPPGSWRGRRPPPETGRSGMGATATTGSGTCIVDGREYRFRLSLQTLEWPTGGWIQFDQRVHFLTERTYGTPPPLESMKPGWVDRETEHGKGFGIDLEAARLPENDWLYLCLGKNDDEPSNAFAFTRVDS